MKTSRKVGAAHRLRLPCTAEQISKEFLRAIEIIHCVSPNFKHKPTLEKADAFGAVGIYKRAVAATMRGEFCGR